MYFDLHDIRSAGETSVVFAIYPRSEAAEARLHVRLLQHDL